MKENWKGEKIGDSWVTDKGAGTLGVTYRKIAEAAENSYRASRIQVYGRVRFAAVRLSGLYKTCTCVCYQVVRYG